MDANLNIESVLDYYDAPICGVARLDDRVLYYNWVDDMLTADGTRKIRCYCAWELSDAEWALLERDVELQAAAALPDGGDGGAAALVRADESARQMGVLHVALESREGVVGFTSYSMPFPSFC
jgi:hypothetical protein